MSCETYTRTKNLKIKNKKKKEFTRYVHIFVIFFGTITVVTERYKLLFFCCVTVLLI